MNDRLRSIRDTVRIFLIDNFLGEHGQLHDDELLFGTGLLTSKGFLQLIMHVESTFDIEIEDDDLSPENFETVSKITTLILNKKDA